MGRGSATKMHQRKGSVDEDETILDEDEQEAIINELQAQSVSHELQFRRLFIVTSVVLGTLLLVLGSQFPEKSSPLTIVSCFLVGSCYVAQAVSMVQQPPSVPSGESKQLPTAMWWPPMHSPSTRVSLHYPDIPAESVP